MRMPGKNKLLQVVLGEWGCDRNSSIPPFEPMNFLGFFRILVYVRSSFKISKVFRSA
jgi:hypothetical protein